MDVADTALAGDNNKGMMRICAYPGCDRLGAERKNRPSRDKWCPMHRGRLTRGTPMDTPPEPRLPWPDRFWVKVNRKSDDECWPWLAYINDGGYGNIMIDGRPHRAHRVAYERLREEIPDGLVCDHLCRNRWCVNPWHLEVVTHKVNIQRGMPFKAKAEPKTHCPSGHEYADDNMRIDHEGYRRCLTCERDQALASYYRRSEFNRLDRTNCAHCAKDVAISPHSKQFANHMIGLGGCLFDCCQLSDTCPGSMRTEAEAAQLIRDRSDLRYWCPAKGAIA